MVSTHRISTREPTPKVIIDYCRKGILAVGERIWMRYGREMDTKYATGWYKSLTRSRVVEKDLHTALILEDDVDWDPRVRSQLSSLGLASQQLPDMIARLELEAPKYDMAHQGPGSIHADTSKHLSLSSSVSTTKSSSLYGRDWDVLWLGHCSASPPAQHNISAPKVLPDRIVLPNDATVLEPNPSHKISPAPYPPHTRVYHRTHNTLCTLAYAVTQKGARKILYEHGIRNFDRGYDFALSEWCDGTTKHMGDRPLCLTSSPPVFGHFQGHRGGGKSDIVDFGSEGVRESVLVQSVRGSLEELVDSGNL
jgi:hypothetical protein